MRWMSNGFYQIANFGVSKPIMWIMIGNRLQHLGYKIRILYYLDKKDFRESCKNVKKLYQKVKEDDILST